MMSVVGIIKNTDDKRVKSFDSSIQI